LQDYHSDCADENDCSGKTESADSIHCAETIEELTSAR
jgi:hypothetical protein